MDSFIQKARDLFPALNCGIASVYLRYCLGAGQIVHGSYAGVNHTFLVLNGIIVDITADQFGGPPIYVGPPTLPWSLPSLERSTPGTTSDQALT